MEVDEILRNIIVSDLQIADNRVAIYNQNWNPPKDNGLYIVISTRNPRIISNTNYFDNVTNEEVKETGTFTDLDIDITSKDRTAYQRKEEVLQALTSYASLQAQEIYQIKIFRNEQILDLSFIEGGSALNRFKISCSIAGLKSKRTAIPYYTQFIDPQELVKP